MPKPKPRTAKSKRDPEDPDVLRRRGIYEKAKTFEEKVADLFALQGYRTTVDYKRDDMQYDIRLEYTLGVLPIHVLVECKNLGGKVTQKDVREFASKVEYATRVDKLPFQAILVASSDFANNAHEAARNLRVQLTTYEDLLRSLVDLRPVRDAAIRAFQGTPLETMYVEQEVVFEAGIKPGQEIERKSLTREVLRWLNEPSSTFLALLGDFGCGKTSFSKRLACELAQGKSGTRVPVLIDLREGGSTTVTLESLLTQHFQRLSSQPFNPQALFQLNREGYLVLIFDGFDETIVYTEPRRYVENLRQILRAAEGKAKVVMTCRTHYFRDRPEALRNLGKAPAVVSTQGATSLYEELQSRPGTEVGYLLEFREDQIAEYLQKALPPPADWQAFREQIRNTYNLDNLAERPFLLEIIVKTLPRLLERRGEEVTLADLYESYCESWFSHTDFRLTLTRDYKVALVEYLARLVWDSPENRVHHKVLFEEATSFIQDRQLTPHDKDRIDYEVRTALFLHRDAEGYYSFIHRSFLEFFIARTLRAGLVEGEAGCLALKRITREVAFFLELWPEAKRIPELAGRVLEAPYQARVSENALLLLYFHALAKLGPLVGPQTGKEPEILEIQKAFSGMSPKAIHLEGADLAGATLPGIDLSDARLDGAKLSRADLRQASLDRACLVRADLGSVDFRKGSAEGADFSEADLNHLDGREGNFRKALLQNADLSFARLIRADLQHTNLEGAETVGIALLDAQGVEQLILANTAGGSRARVLDVRWHAGYSTPVTSLTWSPDSRCVATGSFDGTVKVWDVRGGQLLNSLVGHESAISSVAWSPDGMYLASGSQDQSVKMWEVASGRLTNSLSGHESGVASVVWSPDGTLLASGSYDCTVKVWDSASGRLLNTVPAQASVSSVAWSPDGTRLASGSREKTVKLWDSSSGQLLNTLAGHETSVSTVSWSPDGTRLASGSYDRTVKVWEAASGRLVNTLAGHDNSVNSVAWSPDGTRLASGSDDKTVKVWEAASGRLLNTLAGHDNSVLTVAWSPDGTRLASGADDDTMKVWDSASGHLLSSLPSHNSSVLTVSWSPDGARLASGALDQTIKVWDSFSGRLLNTLSGHESSVLTVSWSPDGTRLASGAWDKTVKVWEPASGRLINSLSGHQDWVRSVSWSPDGTRLASGADDRKVKVWEASSGRLLNTLSAHKNSVLAVAWSPDGTRLVSGSSDQTVKVWEAASGRRINSLSGHKGRVWSVAWSPDGTRLVSGSWDQRLKVWDSASGRLLNTLLGHHNSVFSVAWSPDGTRLASGSYDRTVRLWDAASGEELQRLEISPLLTSLSWSFNGRWLAVSFRLGFIEIWEVEADPPRLLIRLYSIPGGSGFAATPDGYVFGSPEALEWVRFGDGWALYDVTDVPERVSEERVLAALRLKSR